MAHQSTYRHIKADFTKEPTEEEINAYGQEGWCLRALIAIPKTWNTSNSGQRAGQIDHWVAVFSKHVWVIDGVSAEIRI